MEKIINPKQLKFVISLACTNNKKQAAIEAGYNIKYVEKLLLMPHIQASLDLHRKKLAQDSMWSHLDILSKIRITVERCMQEVPTKEKGVFKFDASNALKGLELYGKYHGMWVENFKHTLNPPTTNNPVEVAVTQVQSDLRNLFSRTPEKNDSELINIIESDIIDIESSITEAQDNDIEET